MLVTLLTLRTSCKQQSDNVGQGFISDAEWDGYIRTAYADLYAKIVQAFGNDYFVQTPAAGYTFTTDGINNLFALPTTGSNQLVFKLLGVDLQINGSTRWAALKAFQFADRNRMSAFNGNVPMAGQTVRLLYVPFPTLPTLDADTIDGINSWEDWIVIECCIKALTKEESDISALLVRRKAFQDRLDSEMENRDASAAAGAIVDTRGRSEGGMKYRLNGNSIWLTGSSALPEWGADWDGWSAY